MATAPDASTRRALSAEVAERGPLPLAEAVGYTLEACEAVAEAHAAGIAHGDLRPENVFLARGPGGTTVEVPFVGRRSADASRQDVARDIAALGGLLRTLISGMNDYELDGAKTLPSTVAEIVARALASGSDAPFQNVSELAQELAPYAPPDHPSARRIALLMSRAGIVGSGMPLPAPQVDQADQADQASTLGEEWFGPRSLRALLVREPSVRRRGLVFALVSLALVGFTLGGCLFLWR
ncbi:MAG TPA: hypothetical protein VLT33_07020, partial [Labilithrix sp.]|nr:hypothetical protein [Labilithrix sp.]